MPSTPTPDEIAEGAALELANWRGADADAHDAEAAALAVAAEHLEAAAGIVDKVARGNLAVAIDTLRTEQARHERDAAIARGRAA